MIYCDILDPPFNRSAVHVGKFSGLERIGKLGRELDSG